MIKKVKYFGVLIIPYLLILIAAYLILDNYQIEYSYYENCKGDWVDKQTCTPGYRTAYRDFKAPEEYSIAITLISLAVGNFIIPKLIQLFKKK